MINYKENNAHQYSACNKEKELYPFYNCYDFLKIDDQSIKSCQYERIFKKRLLCDMQIKCIDDSFLLLKIRNKDSYEEDREFLNSIYQWIDKENINKEKKKKVIITIWDCYVKESNTLDLRGFGLSSIPILPENICYLLLSNNKLSAIPPILPEKIVYLDLSHNIISTVDIDYLNSLQYLETLDLSSNQLTEFPEMSNNIVVLNCKNNPIEETPCCLNSSFPKLKYLGFDFNSLTKDKKTNIQLKVSCLTKQYMAEENIHEFSEVIKDKTMNFSVSTTVFRAPPLPYFYRTMQVIQRECMVKVAREKNKEQKSVNNHIDFEQKNYMFLGKKLPLLCATEPQFGCFSLNGYRGFIVENQGHSLKKFLKATNGFDDSLIKILGRRIIEILISMQEIKFYHNDLKTDNILIDQRGEIHFIDYGFSIQPENEFIKGGSIFSIPPEFFEDSRYDPSCKDAYSLGVILYKFFNVNFHIGMYKNASSWRNSFRNPRIFRGKVFLDEALNYDLKEIILGLTKYRPEDRYTLKQVLEKPFFKQCELKDRSFMELSLQYGDIIRSLKRECHTSEREQLLINKVRSLKILMDYKDTENKIKQYEFYQNVIEKSRAFLSTCSEHICEIKCKNNIQRNMKSLELIINKYCGELNELKEKKFEHRKKEIEEFIFSMRKLLNLVKDNNIKKAQKILQRYFCNCEKMLENIKSVIWEYKITLNELSQRNIDI